MKLRHLGLIMFFSIICGTPAHARLTAFLESQYIQVTYTHDRAEIQSKCAARDIDSFRTLYNRYDGVAQSGGASLSEVSSECNSYLTRIYAVSNPRHGRHEGAYTTQVLVCNTSDDHGSYCFARMIYQGAPNDVVCAPVGNICPRGPACLQDPTDADSRIDAIMAQGDAQTCRLATVQQPNPGESDDDAPVLAAPAGGGGGGR